MQHPGQLVDIGGRRIHAVSAGEPIPGVPPIVFEAGIAATSLSWCLVVPKIATRNIAYDRAGLGWSAEAKISGTARDAASDLKVLLERSGEPGPYVLVGHSFGGLIVRVFQQMHPDLVAGMVLVDPVVRAEWREPSTQRLGMLQRAATLSRRGALLAQMGVVRLALKMVLRGSKHVPKLVARASAGNGASVATRLAGEVRKMPRELWPAVAAHWSEARSFRAMAANLESLPFSCRQLDEGKSLGDCPLVILSASSSPPHAMREHESDARLSTRGEHIVVPDSGHWILLDDPDAVADAIQRVVNRINETKSLQT